MAFPSADGGADSAGRDEGGHARRRAGEGAYSGGRGHAPGRAGEGAYSGGRGHAPGHPGEGANSGGRGHAPGHTGGRGHAPGHTGGGANSGGRGHAPGRTGEGANSGGRGHAPGHTGEGANSGEGGYSWEGAFPPDLSIRELIPNELHLFRPWEASGANPTRPPHPWFSRLAVALRLRVRPEFSMCQGDNPMGFQIVHVRPKPPQIKRAEILQVKQELDNILKEFRLKLRIPAEFDAKSSVTVQQPWTGVILKSGIAISVFLASMRRPGPMQLLRGVGNNAVDAAMRYESENQQYVRVFQNFTLNMRAIIEYALENEEITAEHAKDLLDYVGKYDAIVSMLLARDGSRFFSLNALKTILQLPPGVVSLVDKLRAFGSAFRAAFSFADFAYRVSQSVGHPALFEDIGKEATDVTRDHFLLNKVHLDAMQKYSVTLGSEIDGLNLLKKLMVNVRNSDLSICLSASEVNPRQAAEPNGANVNLYNKPYFAELHLEKVFADNIKGMLHVPYSLRNSKLELQSLHQYQSISGSIGLNKNTKPCLSLSSYWGVKDLKLHVESLGFGGKLEINDGDSWINCSAGVSVSSLWGNLGLTFKQPGIFTAACSSGIGNPRTVLGGYISYSYEEDRTKFAAGVLHSVDNSMYLKGWIRSDKVLSGVISKSFGKSRLNLITEVDFKDFRKPPRAGLYFSFP